MKIEVQFNNKGIMNNLKFQMVDGSVLEVVSSNFSNAPCRYIGREIRFYDQSKGHYAEEDAKMLLPRILMVTTAEIIDNATVSDAELISIAFYDGKNEDELLWYLPNSVMEKYQKITVDMDGYQETMTMEKYNKIAKFVRQKDRLENLDSAIASQLNELYFANVVKFLEKETAVSPDVITSEWSEIEDYSGEDEQEILDNIIKKRGGMAWYNLISNKGTEYECEDRVLLMCRDAETWMENIRERDNGTEMLLNKGDIILKDDYGCDVDLFFVDDIIEQEKESL